MPREKETLENIQLDSELETNQVVSEIKEVSEAETLFSEFSLFLEKKMEIIENIEDGGIKTTTSTGIDLVDAILGGGFAIGALNIIVGQPGSGKTMLAIQAMAQMMNKYAGNIISAFLDSEEATTKIRLKNLGVKYPSKILNDITVEKVFKFIEGVSLFKQEKGTVDIPSMVIWDSIANTSSQKERETEDINSVIGYKARLLSMLLPKYIAKCAKNNICVIAVNQMREVLNIGQFAPAKDLKFMTQSKDMNGGMALKFNAFHLIEMKVGQVLTQDKYGFDGVKTKIKAVKNKLFQPNIEIEILGSFNSGFSNFWTNYNFLTESKRLNTGAWNYLISKPEKKFRTKDALNLYKTDEEFRMDFDKASKEAIQTDIIDKYSTSCKENVI